MYFRIAALLVLFIGSAALHGEAQTAPNPTASPAVQQDRVPVFRVTVVGRTTQAINYRPRHGVTNLGFEGTALLPSAKGRARIEGDKGVIAIDVRFDKLPPAARFGPEYLTYVLWAITPEGRATNLGELQVDDDEAKLETTTELQAFGLVVTAEPYFAVTQPSDVVVLENITRRDTIGDAELIEAKYELLKRGSYTMSHDVRQARIRELEPGAPLDLAEARNAVALARLAGADRYASDTYAKAERLLREAETARERRRNRNDVMMPARQAVQTAEDARIIALQKQEEAAVAEQRTMMLRRESEAIAQAQREQARRQQAEADRLAAEQRTAEATAAREAAERARREADAAADRLARERQAADAARAAADVARADAEWRAYHAQSAVTQSEQEKAELRARLREQLSLILETRETARGLIVNLSDVLFDTGKATLKPGAREKLARVAGVLLAHPGLQIEVDGHTDSVGGSDYNQRLSEQRAASVRAYLVQQGIAPTVIAAFGFGETSPVVANDTAAGRQRNRRVELVVAGETIGITSDTIRR
jgi:outer membrane protein OmpA-like peptidoglycan-associated protein